jgi:hypothetical protein
LALALWPSVVVVVRQAMQPALQRPRWAAQAVVVQAKHKSQAPLEPPAKVLRVATGAAARLALAAAAAVRVAQVRLPLLHLNPVTGVLV